MGVLVLFLKKKDGSLKMCIDYLKFNKVTIKNKYPFPSIINDFFDLLQGASYFSKKKNLWWSYHILTVRGIDMPKTPFSKTYNHLEFLVMSFGLTNDTIDFMDLMTWVFWNYLNSFVIVFIDDILVYTKSEDVHMFHLMVVL